MSFLFSVESLGASLLFREGRRATKESVLFQFDGEGEVGDDLGLRVENVDGEGGGNPVFAGAGGAVAPGEVRAGLDGRFEDGAVGPRHFVFLSVRAEVDAGAFVDEAGMGRKCYGRGFSSGGGDWGGRGEGLEDVRLVKDFNVEEFLRIEEVPYPGILDGSVVVFVLEILRDQELVPEDGIRVCQGGSRMIMHQDREEVSERTTYCGGWE